MHEKSRYIRSVNIINLKQVLVGLPPGLFRIVLQKQNLSYGSQWLKINNFGPAGLIMVVSGYEINRWQASRSSVTTKMGGSVVLVDPRSWLNQEKKQAQPANLDEWWLSQAQPIFLFYYQKILLETKTTILIFFKIFPEITFKKNRNHMIFTDGVELAKRACAHRSMENKF